MLTRGASKRQKAATASQPINKASSLDRIFSDSLLCLISSFLDISSHFRLAKTCNRMSGIGKLAPSWFPVISYPRNFPLRVFESLRPREMGLYTNRESFLQALLKMTSVRYLSLTCSPDERNCSATLLSYLRNCPLKTLEFENPCFPDGL